MHRVAQIKLVFVFCITFRVFRVCSRYAHTMSEASTFFRADSHQGLFALAFHGVVSEIVNHLASECTRDKTSVCAA